MVRANIHYQKLATSYLFTKIADLVRQFSNKNPQKNIIKLGIGDVVLPLTPAITTAFHEGVRDLEQADSFHGYGPEQGYGFLRECIATHDFQSRGVAIDPEEVIVSDGSKCDVGNFQELFATDSRIAVPDPVYPVYVDSNVMAGRTGECIEGRYEGLYYLEGSVDNEFMPPPPNEAVEVIYLCFPNNPTGATASRELLQLYVDYALKHKALLLFDAAYTEYICDPSLPKSIFEIPRAKECAVEFRSFSKTAGFTGVRCAYTVIPHEVQISMEKQTVSLRDLWLRRHSTKFNGASYPVQKAATAVYSNEGKQEVRERISYYMENAELIRTAMEKIGFSCYGGKNAPYVWVNVQEDSWKFFQKVLDNTAVVITPGIGFGKMGAQFIRISAFNHKDKVQEAMQRIEQFFS